MKAGFYEIDITPPPGTLKIGWLRKVIGTKILDPIFARVAVFENGDRYISFVQLDTLCVRWSTTNEIRKRIRNKYNIDGNCIMVTATHNHAGPAVANVGDVPRDEKYMEEMVEKTSEAFGYALKNMTEAEIGFNSVFEFDIAHNRRVVMRDGTVRTHGSFKDKNALYIEGPIDPEVAVIAVKSRKGDKVGCLVNFSCHPTHFGGEDIISAGFPGVMAKVLKEKGWHAALFLNGPSGNIHTSNPATGGGMSMEEAGKKLAEDAERAIEGMHFEKDLPLFYCSETVNLPYRRYTKEEVDGKIRGSQRFIDSAIYDRGMPALLDRIKTRKVQPAEIQVLSIGNIDIAAFPAEYFVEFALSIKEAVYPRHALAVATANGMVGYVPTKNAFLRGGYETTFAASSRMAPEAGDIMLETAKRLILNKK